MIAVIERFRDWGGFFVLLFLQRILMDLVRGAYARVNALVDRTLPDDLPLGAGAWLEEQIATRKLDVRLIVDPAAGDEGDAYYPATKTLVLSRAVWNKRDASFWAVAAHELGHALVYRTNIVLRGAFLAGRIAVRSLSQAGVLLLLGNVLYGIPQIDRLAVRILAWGLVGHVVLLVDEGTASVIAIRTLIKDARLDRSARIGVVARLAAGFMTYVAGFVGQIIVVWRSDVMIARVEAEAHFVAGRPIGTLGLAAIAISGVAVACLAGYEIVRTLRRPKFVSLEDAVIAEQRARLRDIARGALALVLVALVWDQPQGTLLVVACLAAIYASRTFLGLIASGASFVVSFALYAIYLPLSVIYAAVLAVVRKIRPRPSVPPAPPTVVPPMSPEAQARFEEMTLASYNHPTLTRRASAIAFAALHLAFVVTILVLLLVPT